MSSLTFLGAAGEVTGSCYLIDTGAARILLECGLHQGDPDTEARNREPFSFDPASLDAVVVSHAHLDHSGLLPKLVRDGYAGPIHVTRATRDLLDVMLHDSAHLLAREANGDEPPLYDADDVDRTLRQCEGVVYDSDVAVADGVTVRFRDAGHILGSAVVVMQLRTDDGPCRLVFSGDLGNECAPLLRDPVALAQADVAFMESTYGDRDHRPMSRTLAELEEILARAWQDGGNVLIPAFAVGRSQEILFRLGELYHAGRLHQNAVFLDSPMAIAATGIYDRYRHIYDREDLAALQSEGAATLASWLPPLRLTRTPEESMDINRLSGGAVIIAGSGMCTGGGIRHHLKHNLWRREARVVIVGFQAAGTPGRALVDGTRSLRIFGKEIPVRAAVHTLGGFSAHAGQSDLVAWAARLGPPRPSLYLVHGEPDKRDTLRDVLDERLRWRAETPRPGERIRLGHDQPAGTHPAHGLGGVPFALPEPSGQRVGA